MMDANAAWIARTAEAVGSGPNESAQDQWMVGGVLAPQHFLYFLPDPHGQGSLRPTFDDRNGALQTGAAGGFCQ